MSSDLTNASSSGNVLVKNKSSGHQAQGTMSTTTVQRVTSPSLGNMNTTIQSNAGIGTLTFGRSSNSSLLNKGRSSPETLGRASSGTSSAGLSTASSSSSAQMSPRPSSTASSNAPKSSAKSEKKKKKKKRKSTSNTKSSASIPKKGANRPWSAEEHSRFIQALEKYGNGRTGNEWKLMAAFVRTRGEEELRAHGRKYFLKLQVAQTRVQAPSEDILIDPMSTKVSNEVSSGVLQYHPHPVGWKPSSISQVGAAFNHRQAMQEVYTKPAPKFSDIIKLVKKHGCRGAEDVIEKRIKAEKKKKKENGKVTGNPNQHEKPHRWTISEDEVFESALSIYDEDMVGRWEIIAGLFPDKSVTDVRNRYQELLIDIAGIESTFINVSHFQTHKKKTIKKGDDEKKSKDVVDPLMEVEKLDCKVVDGKVRLVGLPEEVDGKKRKSKKKKKDEKVKKKKEKKKKKEGSQSSGSTVSAATNSPTGL